MTLAKNFLFLVISLLVSLLFTTKTFAEVYSYELSITKSSVGSEDIVNNSAVPKSQILSNGSTVQLKVIDPAQPSSSFEIPDSDWTVSIASYNDQGQKITSGNGFWSVFCSKNNNVQDCSLSFTNGADLNGYYAVLESVAKVGTHETNSVSFKLAISDFAQSSNSNSPIVTSTNSNSNPTATLSGNSNQNVEPIITSDPPSSLTSLETVAQNTANAIGSVSSMIKESIQTTLKIPTAQTQTTLSVASASLTAVSSLWYSVGFLGVRRKKKWWGKVVDRSSTPIFGVKLYLKKQTNEGWKIVAEAISDQEGEFDFPFEQEGIYTIEAQKQHFQVLPSEEMNFPIGQSGEIGKPITIQMAPESNRYLYKKYFHKNPLILLLVISLPVLGTMLLLGDSTIHQYLSLIICLYIISWFLCVFAVRKSRRVYIN